MTIRKKMIALKEALQVKILQDLLSKIDQGSHFMVAGVNSSCYPYHLTLNLSKTRPEYVSDYKGGHLQSEEAVIELYQNIIPVFMRWAGITNIKTRGFRLVVETSPDQKQTQIHLIAGNEQIPLLSQNPQDWLSLPVKWNPDVESAPFFDSCSVAAAQSRHQMAFGNQMLYASRSKAVFGVVDGDPKSSTHFLVLARQPFSCILDPEFTIDHLIRFFEIAYALSVQQGINQQAVRLVINTGQGAQVGPRVHLHVLSSPDKLPSMFPIDYGFSITTEGIIKAPENSSRHTTVLDLIRDRLAIKGFSPEAKQAKLELDQKIMRVLAQLK